MIPGKSDYSSSELMALVQVPPTRAVAGPQVSIGTALHHLDVIADIPDECQGGCDGLDALCYHLDETTVRKAISALHAVLDRFKEWETIR